MIDVCGCCWSALSVLLSIGAVVSVLSARRFGGSTVAGGLDGTNGLGSVGCCSVSLDRAGIGVCVYSVLRGMNGAASAESLLLAALFTFSAVRGAVCMSAVCSCV